MLTNHDSDRLACACEQQLARCCCHQPWAVIAYTELSCDFTHLVNLGSAAMSRQRVGPFFSDVCRKSENDRKNKQGPPFPMHNLFVRCCFYFEACVWKLIIVIALALHWLAFKPVRRGCSKQRRTASAAKSERPLIVLPGARGVGSVKI